MTTTAEMRRDINSIVRGEKPSEQLKYRDRNPFRKIDLIRILEYLTDEDVDHGQEKSRLRYKVMLLMEDDVDPFDATTPLKKHQIRELHEMVV